MKAPLLTPAEVRDLFDYADGALLWRVDRGPRARKGRSAGTIRPGGNVSILIGKRLYQRPRLVFALHRGCWPDGELRHVDGDRGNDRFENLRDMPVHALRRLIKGASHLPGTHLQDGRWIASITTLGTRVYLGSFGTETEAHAAFAAAHVAVHGNRSPYAQGIEVAAGKKRELDNMLGGYANV